MKLNFVMAACALALAACGGGGGGSGDSGSSSGGSVSVVPQPPAPVVGAAQNIYVGNTADGREIYTIALENDQFYTMYGHTVGNAFLVSGFVQGDGASNNGVFTSANGVDSNSNNTRTAATINATYTVGLNLNGTIVEPTGNVGFTSAPIAASLLNYNSAAKLSDIAGHWNVTSLRGFASSFDIGATGTFTGTSSGCSLSGTFTPRASGKNVFDMTMSFGPAPCQIPNGTIKGMAIDYVATGGQRQLIVAGIDTTRINTAAFFGAR